MISKVSEEISKENDPTIKLSNPLNQASLFKNLLFVSSIFLVLGTAILRLDLVPSVLLGCSVIGFNYFLTIKLVRKLLLYQKLQALDIIFLLTKFGISVIVLFGALIILELPPNGLLIGISNVALATIIFTLFRVISPKKFF